MTKKIERLTLVRGDEWEGVYLDNRLWIEGHRFSLAQVMHELGGKVVQFGDVITPDDVWLMDRGTLPTRLDDVKRETER